MLVSRSRRAARSIFTLTRELILILAVGALGGQLLMALNGGNPIGTAALAASSLSVQPVPRIASLELDLNPHNPAEVRSVFLTLVDSEQAAPELLRISPTTDNHKQYDCHVESSGIWRCPTPGLKVAELEQIVLKQ